MLLRLAGTSMRACALKSASGTSTVQNEHSAMANHHKFSPALLKSDYPSVNRNFTTLTNVICNQTMSNQPNHANHLYLSQKVQSLKAIKVSSRKFTRPALDHNELQISGSSSSATLLEMKKFLRQKSVDFTESHACLVITLPRHAVAHNRDAATVKVFPGASFDEILDRSLTKIYVNKLTSRFVCPDELVFGDWTNLRSFLLTRQKIKFAKKGEVTEPLVPLGHSLNLDQVFDKNCSVLWNESTPIEALDAKEFKEILKTFKLSAKDVKIEDFVQFEVRVTKFGGNTHSLLFPIRYPFNGKLVGLKKVGLDNESGHIFEENFPTEKDVSSLQVTEGKPWIHRIFPLPLGLDRAIQSGSSSVILVTSVLDALALSSHSNVVTLADGAGNLPPEHLPFFENFAQIVFWFPETVCAADAVQTFARKLGDRRCQAVSREFSQPSIWISRRKPCPESAVGLNQILRKHLRPCCHEYITTFESLREDVYLELAHLDEVQGVKWKRFEPMNELIRGFRRGELTIFSGRTGSGKTTFMSEYSLDLCMQGVNTLWGSFEVSNTRLAKMQLKQFSGINLEDNIDLFDSYADKFQKLPMFYLTFHGAQELEKVLEAMSTAVYLYDISHAIIDNIQFMMGLTTKNLDRFYAQDLIIQKLRKFATLHNVHLSLVIHPRKEEIGENLNTNSIFGGAKATQEADNVILLQEEALNPKLKRKFIQVMKNRFSGDLGTMPLYFNRPTLTFSKKIFQKDRTSMRRTKKETEPSTKPSPGIIINEDYNDDQLS